MDFENARWVKLYCQDTGTWLRLGWQGRTVALHLLRSVNSSGVLSDLGTEPELILAELLRLPLEADEDRLRLAASLLRQMPGGRAMIFVPTIKVGQLVQAGLQAVLYKPFRLDQLLETVEQLVTGVKANQPADR